MYILDCVVVIYWQWSTVRYPHVSPGTKQCIYINCIPQKSSRNCHYYNYVQFLSYLLVCLAELHLAPRYSTDLVFGKPYHCDGGNRGNAIRH